MAWAPLANLQGPSGDLHVQPAGIFGGLWRDANTGKEGIAVTDKHVVTDITTPIGTPVGCSLSRGTVTVTQAGVWMFQGAAQYRGSNSAIRAVYFVRGSDSAGMPRYGLLGAGSADSLSTSATFTLSAGDTVSFCTTRWSGADLFVWSSGGSTVTATWLGNPQQNATTPPPPVVAQLIDASVITTDARQANLFRVSLAGNRTLAAPTSPVDGQRVVWEITASGGQRQLALATGAGGFVFGRDVTGLTATSAGTTDYLGAIYNMAVNRWRVVAYTKGF